MTRLRARAGTWLALLLVAGLLAAPFASASPPLTYGKALGDGQFGVPYAESTSPSWPYSYPSVGPEPLADGAMVYDIALGFEMVNPTPVPVSLLVVTETWTPGAQTIYRNVTGANGTYSLVPETVSVRLDPYWANSTITALAGSSGVATISLRQTGAQSPLEVRVGSAVWELSYLTPATSSVAGVYTAGGIWAFAAMIALVTLAAILGALWAAQRLAGRIGRSPPVPRWWPALWVGVPLFWFLTGYVSFNQTLGSLSPLALPVPLAIAAYPYLPRLFTRFFDMVEIEGVEPLSMEEGANPKIILPLVRHQGGLRCAAQTWWEAFLSHWVGLPEVRGYTVELLGRKAQVQPRLMRTSCPLDGYYAAEASASCWYDARRGIRRPRHRLEWWRTESVPVLGPDGGKIASKSRRHLSPHVVAGYLEATFPPKRPVAQELAGVRSAEVEAHDNEVDRLENADLRGTLRHLSRAYARDSLRAHDEAATRQDMPRSRDELVQLVARNRRKGSTPADDDASEDSADG